MNNSSDFLNTAEAQALRKAKLEARQVFDEAERKYHKALAAVMHSDSSGEAALATLRREGRACAEALTRYLTATMAWLTYVDRGASSDRARD